MERLQRAKASRKAYRSHLTRTYRKIDEILEAEAPVTDTQIAVLTSTLEQLNQKKTTITQLDSQIADAMETPEDLESEILESEGIRDELADKITRIRQFLDLRSRTSTRPLDVHTTEIVPTTSVSEAPLISTTARREPVSRLPKLSLPIFSGDPLTWQGFRDSFDAAVHNNPTLDGVQKFNYLRAQLQGEAARVISGLPLTSGNYNNAMTLLTERFGQPHKIINAHMQALLDVTNPVNSLSSLQLFYDTIEGHIRGLATLGKSEESYGALLIPIILGKLPIDLQRNLAREHGNLEWTLSDLKQGILKEIRVLESGLSINPATRLSFDQSPMMTTASLHTGATANNNSKLQNSSPKRPCVFCKSTTHPPTKCDKIVDHQKRIDFIKRENLCFNCFGHHKASHCNSKYRCKTCKRKHHTSLCDTTSTTNNDPNQTKNITSPPKNEPTTALVIPVSSQCTHNLISSTSTSCLLKTAVAEVRAGTHCGKANILFDEGAQKSFISQKLADSLNVQPYEQQSICLSSFGGTATPTKLQATHVYLRTRAGDEIPLSVLIVPKIATPLKNLVYSPDKHFPYLQGLTLAHPVTHTSDFEISLLIGADLYWSIVEDHIIRGHGPTAMQSKLGYLLSGPIMSPQTIDKTLQVFHTVVQLIEENDINKFWDVESTGTLSTTESPSDNQFLASYLKSSVTCQQDGSYTVKFPWKDKHPPLPSNRHVCKQRARSLAHKLSHTPNLLKLYGEIISDQLRRGFIEQVAESEVPSLCHFIPHHPVKKESPTTPIRIVYDCSCRQSTSHPSLNDCLLAGPPFINDLCTLLIRFRTHKIGIVTDIEKAFLHVQLAEDDRHYTYFLWLSKPDDPESKFITYRFKVVLFGSVSSPFMLSATLQHLLNTDGSPVARDIQQNLYVDNILSGFSNEEDAVQYYHKARQIMSNANFNLRSWASNSASLMRVAQEDDVADSRTIVNVLGLLWDTAGDTLALNPKEFTSTHHSLVTKREVLRDMSKIFDPLGIVAPVTIMAKLFMQELWQQQLDWDEPLPDDMRTRWHNIMNNLQQTFSYHIARCYHNPAYISKEIHIFVDASKKAYGAVAYICQDGQPSLIMSKTRVAPIKELTLPKLELMAAVIGTRLYKFILTSLAPQHTDIPVFLWSDSQIVLYWILNQRKLKPFVATRIQEINNSIPSSSWRYCPTQDNPADLLTRGVAYETLVQCKLWKCGPSWITNHKQWPQWNNAVALNLQVDTDEATKPTDSSPLNTPGLHRIINVNDYSNLAKLFRISAYILRFTVNSKLPDISQRKLGPLLPEELNEISQRWIQNCQQTAFTDEFTNLQSKNSRVRCLPIVRQLRLFLDNNNIIRCGGRIHNAPLDRNTKFPALLPKEHPLTKLIVYAVHKEQLHTGVNSTVAALRQRYWIPSARQLVRRLLKRCVICRKVIGKPYSKPDPPPLPHARTKEGKPFEVTGVDFTGALYIKRPEGENKVYICLFTCGLTRAVHLEVVSNLNVETFLQAFRRFVSRKSLPRLMLSDNASTYVAAARDLEQLFSSPKLEGALSSRGVKWQFIPKRAPWYGGFWERLIGLTKTTIKKVLGRSFITLEALQTLVVEIEAVLNDRPLTYVSADVVDPEPLTPSHLLYGRRITTLPHLEMEDDDMSDPTYCTNFTLREKSRRQTQLLQHFQTRWKREYLTSLREIHKATGTNLQTVRVGDIVLVHDDTPRMQWRLAVIEELIQGLDGLVRAARIRTSSGKTNRPIAKLFPLEINMSGDHGVPTCDQGDTVPDDGLADDNTLSVPPRSMRTAAVNARSLIKSWTNTLSVAPEDVKN